MSDASSRFQRGYRWSRVDGAPSLAEVIDAAFDYRGSVTLTLAGGAQLAGYLYNREASVSEPFVEIFPDDGGAAARVRYGDIEALEVTGKDTAEGKSFETWLETYQAKKAAEARGETVDSIDLFPEPLD